MPRENKISGLFYFVVCFFLFVCGVCWFFVVLLLGFLFVVFCFFLIQSLRNALIPHSLPLVLVLPTLTSIFQGASMRCLLNRLILLALS